MVATPSTQALSGLSAVTEARPTKDGELGRTGIDLFNGSNEPVYRLVVGIAFIQGTPTRQPSRSVSGSFRVTTVNEDLLLAHAGRFIRMRKAGRTELRDGKTIDWKSLKPRLVDPSTSHLIRFDKSF